MVASPAVRSSSVRNAVDAVVVEDTDGLCWLEKALDFRAEVPIDFATHFVFAFVQPSDTAFGALSEPTRLTLDDNEVLLAHWAYPYRIQPLFGDSEARVHVLAIARQGVSDWGFRYRGLGGALFEIRLSHSFGRKLIAVDPQEVIEVPVSGSVRGTSALPEPGDILLTRLDNGTFVWVVRHKSGDTSVLDARGTCEAYSEVQGLRRLVLWERPIRRFGFTFDEYGVSRHCPNLARYEANVDESSHSVRIGATIPPLRRKQAEPLADGTEETSTRYDVLRQFHAISIEEALRAPEGAVVLVEASLVVEPGAPVLICKTSRHDTCIGTRTNAVGIEPVRARQRQTLGGPLVVTVRGGRLCDPALTR